MASTNETVELVDLLAGSHSATSSARVGSKLTLLHKLTDMDVSVTLEASMSVEQGVTRRRQIKLTEAELVYSVHTQEVYSHLSARC